MGSIQGGHVLKGAALGATVGSAVPGVGTAIGAGVGAVGGAISDALSSDNDTPQYAWNDPRATSTAMGAGNTMYGRTPTGFQDESNRASDLGQQRGAAFAGQGQGNANMMYGLGNKQGANQVDLNNAAGRDYQYNLDDRNRAMGAMGRLQNFYQQGPGPSAAEAQMRQGNDANMAQSIALAHSGRGVGNNAAAMRQAQFGNAAAGQQMNQQLGVLRANEASNWRGQQLNAMGMEQQGMAGMRGQDLSSMGQNQQTGLSYGQLQGQLYGQGQQNQLGFGTLASGQYTSGEQLRNQILSGQQSSDTSRYGADRGVQVGMAQVGQKQDAANMAMLGSVAGSIGTASGKGGGDVPSYMENNPYTSDIRAKKDIQPASMAGVFDRGTPADLRPAQGYQYDYKDPGAPGAAPGRQLGPMAQDLEKTPAGASTVTTGPDGKKAIDTGRLSLVNTSAISEQQKRIDQLEQLLNNRAKYAPGEQLPGPTQPASNIGFHQSGATGIDAMQAGPYGLPTQEEADQKAAMRQRILAGQ